MSISRDKDGLPLEYGLNYFGYRKGIYRILEIGEECSVVVKVMSSRGVRIKDYDRRMMHNSWFRRTNTTEGLGNTSDIISKFNLLAYTNRYGSRI